MTLLSRDDILNALEVLARELDFQSLSTEIMIGGGAALVFLYDARDTTRDVDAVALISENPAAVWRTAQRIAESLGLPKDWLNDGAKGYLHGLIPGEVLLQYPSLTVRAVAPQQLLAMKLSAWRDDLDIADARLLLSKLAGSRDQVWNQVEPYLVPGRELKARYAFDDLWESEDGRP
jgi:hypothetical protein